MDVNSSFGREGSSPLSLGRSPRGNQQEALPPSRLNCIGARWTKSLALRGRRPQDWRKSSLGSARCDRTQDCAMLRAWQSDHRQRVPSVRVASGWICLNKLLELAVEAHGGLGRWRELRRMTATLSIGGVLVTNTRPSEDGLA